MLLIKLLLAGCLIGEYHGAAAASAGEPEVGGHGAVVADGTRVPLVLESSSEFEPHDHPFYVGGDFQAFKHTRTREIFFIARTHAALGKFMEKLSVVEVFCAPDVNDPAQCLLLASIRSFRDLYERDGRFFEKMLIPELSLFDIYYYCSFSLACAGRENKNVSQWLFSDISLPHAIFLNGVNDKGTIELTLGSFYTLVGEKMASVRSAGFKGEASDLGLVSRCILSSDKIGKYNIDFFRDLDRLCLDYFNFSKKVDEYVKRESREAARRDLAFASLCAEEGVGSKAKKPSPKASARVVENDDDDDGASADIALPASAGKEGQMGRSSERMLLTLRNYQAAAAAARAKPKLPISGNAAKRVKNVERALTSPAAAAAASSSTAPKTDRRYIAELRRRLFEHSLEEMARYDNVLGLGEVLDPLELFDRKKKEEVISYEKMVKKLRGYNVVFVRAGDVHHCWYKRGDNFSFFSLDPSHGIQEKKGASAAWFEILKEKFDSVFGRR